MRNVIAAVIVIALIIIAGAFSLTHKSNPQPQLNPNQSSPSSHNQNLSKGNITIVNMLFTPSQITVAKGGTVTWTNKDSTTHTVVDDLSNVGGPDSGNIAPGATYSFTFNKTGSFQYHCRIHPSMRGTIVVK